MRCFASIVFAASVAAACASGAASAEAAAVGSPPPIAAAPLGSGGVIKVHDYRYRHDHERRQHHSRYRQHNAPFFFYGFPFTQPNLYRPRYQDCFRTWDGRVYCRRY